MDQVWESFAKNPHGYLFEINLRQVTVVNELKKMDIASVKSSSVNWESLTKLVEDYQETLKKKGELFSRLKALGVNIDP